MSDNKGYDEVLKVMHCDPANEYDKVSCYIVMANNGVIYSIVYDSYPYREPEKLRWRYIEIKAWVNNQWNTCLTGVYTVSRDIKGKISLGVKSCENENRCTKDFYLTYGEYVTRDSSLLYVEILDKYFSFGNI